LGSGLKPRICPFPDSDTMPHQPGTVVGGRAPIIGSCQRACSNCMVAEGSGQPRRVVSTTSWDMEPAARKHRGKDSHLATKRYMTLSVVPPRTIVSLGHGWQSPLVSRGLTPPR
jgi:hypothetical protein